MRQDDALYNVPEAEQKITQNFDLFDIIHRIWLR